MNWTRLAAVLLAYQLFIDWVNIFPTERHRDQDRPRAHAGNRSQLCPAAADLVRAVSTIAHRRAAQHARQWAVSAGPPQHLVAAIFLWRVAQRAAGVRAAVSAHLQSAAADPQQSRSRCGTHAAWPDRRRDVRVQHAGVLHNALSRAARSYYCYSGLPCDSVAPRYALRFSVCSIASSTIFKKSICAASL